ncbi:non-ribosomal peptide synthetase [Streptomyces anulatus]|uniref:non-ribosomal peptide synthetase n=1 Tax=Streptomyces anulatus TaxID=1892 RepID=UPI00341AB78D
MARRVPDAVAVTDTVGTLTFSQLDAAATSVAQALWTAGVRPGDLVGVLSGRSRDLVAGLLGVLRTGAAYVAADPHDPPARVASVLGDAQVKMLLVESPGPELPAVSPVLPLAEAVATHAIAPPAVRPGPEDVAYVAYTSGSTGRPKGVCVPHRAVLRLVVDPTYWTIAPGDIVAQHSPIAFDASTAELFGPLLNGATLALAPPGRLGPREIVAFARQARVTHLFLTTGVFHQVADADGLDLPDVRYVLTGGEVLSPPLVESAAKRLPAGALSAAYGPTENTTFTTTHPITGPLGARVPIGTAIGGTRVHVLDDQLDPVPDGEVGTLYAAGAGVAHGYLNLPGLTARRFRPDPFADEPGARMYDTGDLVCRTADGVLEFVGRADGQLKVNGVRIEPEEVEMRLRGEQGVRDAAVVLQDHGPGDRRLAAFYEGSFTVASMRLRRALEEQLPPAMVPSSYTWLESLPLLANGKVDRAQLAAHRSRERSASSDYRPPTGSLETWLVDLWQEVLGVDPVGVDDNFFEIGGHSLTASRITKVILQEHDVLVKARDFYLNPTVAKLAGKTAELLAARDGTSV